MKTLACAILLTLGIAAGSPALAAQVTSTSIAVRDSVPAVKPKWPVPDEPGMLFYIQRSSNSNTVIYRARFRSDGTLDPRRPVEAYWRRYNDEGEKKPLKFVEEQFAYGVRATRGKQPGEYLIRLVAYPDRAVTVRQAGPNRAEATLELGVHRTRPVYFYIDVDDSGMLPSVVKVRAFGRDIESGKAIIETNAISGGTVR